MVKTPRFHCRGMLVQSLVRELRSHMLHGQNNNDNNNLYIYIYIYIYLKVHIKRKEKENQNEIPPNTHQIGQKVLFLFIYFFYKGEIFLKIYREISCARGVGAVNSLNYGIVFQKCHFYYFQTGTVNMLG